MYVCQEVLHYDMGAAAHQAADDAKATLRLLEYMLQHVFPAPASRGARDGTPMATLVVGMRQVVGRIRWLRHEWVA